MALLFRVAIFGLCFSFCFPAYLWTDFMGNGSGTYSDPYVVKSSYCCITCGQAGQPFSLNDCVFDDTPLGTTPGACPASCTSGLICTDSKNNGGISGGGSCCQSVGCEGVDQEGSLYGCECVGERDFYP